MALLVFSMCNNKQYICHVLTICMFECMNIFLLLHIPLILFPVLLLYVFSGYKSDIYLISFTVVLIFLIVLDDVEKFNCFRMNNHNPIGSMKRIVYHYLLFCYNLN